MTCCKERQPRLPFFLCRGTACHAPSSPAGCRYLVGVSWSAAARCRFSVPFRDRPRRH